MVPTGERECHDRRWGKAMLDRPMEWTSPTRGTGGQSLGVNVSAVHAVPLDRAAGVAR